MCDTSRDRNKIVSSRFSLPLSFSILPSHLIFTDRKLMVVEEMRGSSVEEEEERDSNNHSAKFVTSPVPGIKSYKRE